jgi:hypothetical protein
MRDQGRHWTDVSSNKNTGHHINRQRYYVGHFRSFVYGSSTVQCFAGLNSNHVHGISGTFGAVTKVHWLCNVSCCLAMDQQWLQGSFSQTDVRTLTKFYPFLGNSTLRVCVKTNKCTNYSFNLLIICGSSYMFHSALHCHPQRAFLEPSKICSIEVQSTEYCGWAFCV